MERKEVPFIYKNRPSLSKWIDFYFVVQFSCMILSVIKLDVIKLIFFLVCKEGTPEKETFH